MRKSFSYEIERIAKQDPTMVFITGDLGFNAFENLQSTLGDRFINAGVAEQHMVGMAAGMASEGRQVFVYSIAPFIVYRALEQIRNDICFHELPVCLVGNGGGYGYGIMGSSHHALSDVGIISALPNMKVYVPSFDNEVAIHLKEVMQRKAPSYLRLGYAPAHASADKHSAIKAVHTAKRANVTLCLMGPLAHAILAHDNWEKMKHSVDIFTVQEYPIKKLSPELVASLQASKKLLTAEEHYPNAGLGQQLSSLVLQAGVQLEYFKALNAVGYPNQQYGSQVFHQKQSLIDADSIIKEINRIENR